MDILDQAMKIEKQGERLYRSFARKTSDKGAAYIFSWLADQELKHYAIFKKMKAASPVSLEKDPTFKTVRGIFSVWKDTRFILVVKTSQVALYRKALAVEEKTVQLYEKGAHDAENYGHKIILFKVAAEEKAHQKLMENMIEFITKPAVWAENAEFGYRGNEYYL